MKFLEKLTKEQLLAVIVVLCLSISHVGIYSLGIKVGIGRDVVEVHQKDTEVAQDILSKTEVESNVPFNTPTKSANLVDLSLVELLREKIRFHNDEAVFTIFALLNYTGYDFDNHTSYHAVRQGVRDDLSKLNLDLMDNDFFTRNSLNGLQWSDIAAWTNGAPNFEWVHPPYISESVNSNFKEFYEKANISELYKKYQPVYDEFLEGYEPVYLILAEVFETLKLDRERLESYDGIDIYVNLLASHWQGTMWDFPNKIQIVTTPDPRQGANLINVVHEFVHIFSVPLVHRDETGVVKELVSVLNETFGPEYYYGYGDWKLNIDESIVRAVDAWALNEDQIHFTTADNDGFVLTTFIASYIDEIDSYDSFNDWVYGALQSYIDSIGSNAIKPKVDSSIKNAPEVINGQIRIRLTPDFEYPAPDGRIVEVTFPAGTNNFEYKRESGGWQPYEGALELKDGQYLDFRSTDDEGRQYVGGCGVDA